MCLYNIITQDKPSPVPALGFGGKEGLKYLISTLKNAVAITRYTNQQVITVFFCSQGDYWRISFF